jgi:cellulose synthase operon protein YhjQ
VPAHNADKTERRKMMSFRAGGGAECLKVLGGNVGGEVLAVSDQTPDDVATLYSWANLHGAKYRDFSASRAQVREQARKRVQEAMEAERSRAEAEAQAEARFRIEAEGVVETLRETPAPSPVAEPAVLTVPASPAFEPPVPPTPAAPAAVAASKPEPEIESGVEPVSAPIPASRPLSQFPSSYPVPHPGSGSAASPIKAPGSAAQKPVSQSSPVAGAPPTAESISARWFALNSIFSAGIPAPVQVRGRVPAMAVFSLAGGVGKTSIVAALGRALSSSGEHVLLVDTAAFGMLPFFFGAKDQRHDVLRTFVAPDARGESRVDILALDIESFGPGGDAPEPFTQEILRHAGEASRILIDLATASSMTVRRILRMSPLVLIPVMPDVGSVASVGAIEQFFERNSCGMGQPTQPYYLLNQFDEGQHLHRDVREVLRSRLGDRLLPFELRRSSTVGEALAEGMTVTDYAPGSPVAEDYARLSEWVKSLVPPSDRAFRGARWSER